VLIDKYKNTITEFAFASIYRHNKKSESIHSRALHQLSPLWR